MLLTHGTSARSISAAFDSSFVSSLLIFTLASISPLNTSADRLKALLPMRYDRNETPSFALSMRIRVGFAAPLELDTSDTSFILMPSPSDGPASLASIS